MLLLGRAERAQIVAEARRDFPGECCGFLLGTRDGDRTSVTEVRPAANARAGDPRAEAPTARFAIAPDEVLGAHREAAARRLEVVGFYHSHPGGGAAPSQVDRAHAWPGYRYLIVGWSDGEPGELRAWIVAPAGDGFVEELVGEGR
jgi:proteasome lid subunit RPN8/RPN11